MTGVDYEEFFNLDGMQTTRELQEMDEATTSFLATNSYVFISVILFHS